jgi:hypothetical protein
MSPPPDEPRQSLALCHVDGDSSLSILVTDDMCQLQVSRIECTNSGYDENSRSFGNTKLCSSRYAVLTGLQNVAMFWCDIAPTYLVTISIETEFNRLGPSLSPSPRTINPGSALMLLGLFNTQGAFGR